VILYVGISNKKLFLQLPLQLNSIKNKNKRKNYEIKIHTVAYLLYSDGRCNDRSCNAALELADAILFGLTIITYGSAGNTDFIENSFGGHMGKRGHGCHCGGNSHYGWKHKFKKQMAGFV